VGVKKGSRYNYIKLRAKKVTASPWEMIYYYENEEEGIHLTITLTPSINHSQKIIISLSNLSKEKL